MSGSGSGDMTCHGKVLKLHECIDIDLVGAWKFEYGEVLIKDDVKCRELLEGLAKVTRVDEAFSLLENTRMDMRIRDVGARFATYNAMFLEVQKRMEALGLNEKTLVRSFVDGIRHEAVRKAMCLQLETRACMHLEDVAKLAKEMLAMETALCAVRGCEEESGVRQHRSGRGSSTKSTTWTPGQRPPLGLSRWMHSAYSPRSRTGRCMCWCA